NIPHILQYGLCSRSHKNADPNFINIGHGQLIIDRDQHQIGLEGVGMLGEYIPFYFAGHSPMLYLIMNGLQGVQKRPQKDLIFFVCKIEEVSLSGVDFIFTARNAYMQLANSSTDIRDLDKLNWDCCNKRHWKNT